MVCPRLALALGLTGLLAASDAHAADGLSLAPDTRVYVVPSFAVNYTLFTRESPQDFESFLSGFHVWSGIAVHPLAGEALSPFVALGVETEFGRTDGSPRFQHTAMTRVGLSVLLEEGTWLGAMLPTMSVYAMAGARPSVDTAPAAARLGLGFNSFWLPFMVLGEVATLIPGSYEGLVELQGDGERRFMLRFGMGF